MPPRRLLLIRHCQATGQFPDDPLTELGFSQAETLAGFLSGMGIDAAVSSAFKRARQTIEPFAARAGLSARVDPRLNERRLAGGPLENWRDVVRSSFDDLDSRAPGGESGRETLERAWACLNELLDGGHNLPAAVTHGNLMSLALSSLDPAFGYNGWESLSNPDVYLLRESHSGRLAFERLWS